MRRLLLTAAFLMGLCFPAQANDLQRCGISDRDITKAFAEFEAQLPGYIEQARAIARGNSPVPQTDVEAPPGFNAQMMAGSFTQMAEYFQNETGIEKLDVVSGLLFTMGVLGFEFAGKEAVIPLYTKAEQCQRLDDEMRETFKNIRVFMESQNTDEADSSGTGLGTDAASLERLARKRFGTYQAALTDAIEYARDIADTDTAERIDAFNNAFVEICRENGSQDNSATEELLQDRVAGFPQKAQKFFSGQDQAAIDRAVAQALDRCNAYLMNGLTLRVLGSGGGPVGGIAGRIASTLGLDGLRGGVRLTNAEAIDLLLRELQTTAPSSVTATQRLQSALGERAPQVVEPYRLMVNALQSGGGLASSIMSAASYASSPEGLQEAARSIGLDLPTDELYARYYDPENNPELLQAAEAVLYKRNLDSIEQMYLGLVGYFLVEEQAPGLLDNLQVAKTDIRQIQTSLRGDEALITFDRFAGILTTIAITREGVFAANSRLSAREVDLAREKVRASIQAFATGGGGNYDHANAYQIYESLLAPLGEVLAAKPRLTFVSSAFTQEVPLDALPVSLDAGADRNYLIDTHEISFVPGLVSFVNQRQTNPGPVRDLRNLAMVSDPVFAPQRLASATPSAGSALMNLSGAFGEVSDPCALPSVPATSRIADSLSRHLNVISGADLRGSNATEAGLRQAAATKAWKEADVVAFNTHGLLGGQTPSRLGGDPALMLSPASGQCPAPVNESNPEDGFLTASEVYGLGLNARLVLLTACNTAAVNEDMGEPLSGLARAFFANGAQAILVSNWEALVGRGNTDGPTEQFMDALFSNISHGMSLSASVRSAKLTTRNEFPHPAAWATFSLVGNGG